ncbi:hypothetical protein INR49_030462 [Caranx melampygus]|nr:hypothetical protein INR49_030462 [Caranx melampygus]
MWDARKVLLATVVFTAVFYRLAAFEKKRLDAALNAVDDLYDKCSEEAKRKLTDSDLLEKELNRSVEFKKAWERSIHCSEQVPEGEQKQTIALSAYVAAGHDFQKIFNDEVETKGVNKSTYENDFNFKSLHFLLMRSMKMQPDNCKTVYSWLEDYQIDVEKGSKVRLGRFMMAEESFPEVMRFIPEGSVILNITSCFFVSLRNNTCTGKSCNVLLLSPAEVFTVERKYDMLSDDTGDFTVIDLKHSGLKSYHGCYLSRSHANVSSQWLVLMLVASSLIFLYC